MAGPLRLFFDVQNRKLVKSFTDTTGASFPLLRQGESPAIQLYFVDPNGGTTSDPFDYVNFGSSTIKMATIAGDPTGGPDTAIASQETWTAITNGFQATYNCNTVGISNAIGSAASISCTTEIEVTEPGESPVKYFQGSNTIQAAVIDTSTVGPAAATEYLSRNEGNATYVKIIGAAGDTITLPSPDGTKAVVIGCNNNGTVRLDIIDPYTG